jgi:hypothetical protein
VLSGFRIHFQCINAALHNCMLAHEDKHIFDLENDIFPCDKEKCRFKVQVYCPIGPGDKKNTECSGHCAELRCLQTKPPTRPVQDRIQAVKQSMSNDCQGKGRLGCVRP